MTTPNNKPAPSAEDRKRLPKFLLILLVSAVVGGVIGFNSVALIGGSAVQSVSAGLLWLVRYALPIAAPLVCLGLTVGSAVLYHRAKKQFEAWDGRDDDDGVIDRCGDTLELALVLSNLILFVVLLMLSVALILPGLPAILSCVGFALVFLGVLTFLQQQIIALTKALCPEKQGSIFDMKFHSKWLQSCDEAEQKQIGEASQAAMKATTTTCLALWFILLIASIPFGYGPLPCLVVLLIWAVQTISYCLACIRLGKRKK